MAFQINVLYDDLLNGINEVHLLIDDDENQMQYHLDDM
jgi:hypothetical protein